MSSYKPIDSKREEFRKYLERTGVMDALTKALVALYEEIEKPDDALGYVRSYLGGGTEEFRSMQKDKMDLSGLKEGGDQASSSHKNESTYKPDSIRHMGAEGDAPSTKNPTSDGTDFDDSGKTDVAPVSGDGAV